MRARGFAELSWMGASFVLLVCLPLHLHDVDTDWCNRSPVLPFFACCSEISPRGFSLGLESASSQLSMVQTFFLVYYTNTRQPFSLSLFSVCYRHKSFFVYLFPFFLLAFLHDIQINNRGNWRGGKGRKKRKGSLSFVAWPKRLTRDGEKYKC